MKKCPFCAEEIQDEAILCRFCHSDLRATTVTTNAEPRDKTLQAASEPKLKLLRVMSALGLVWFTFCLIMQSCLAVLGDLEGANGYGKVGILCAIIFSTIVLVQTWGRNALMTPSIMSFIGLIWFALCLFFAVTQSNTNPAGAAGDGILGLLYSIPLALVVLVKSFKRFQNHPPIATRANQPMIGTSAKSPFHIKCPNCANIEEVALDQFANVRAYKNFIAEHSSFFGSVKFTCLRCETIFKVGAQRVR